jgi:hypothetical protein
MTDRSFVEDGVTSEISPMAYAPSWVDRFGGWIKGRPWPGRAVYLGIGLTLVAVQAIALWAEGATSVGSSLSAQAFLAGAIAFLLAMFHYLDDRAGEALMALRPLLRADDMTFRDLEYRLTTLPAWPALLASLAGIAVNVLLELMAGSYSPESLASYPVSRTLLRIAYFVCWWIMWVFLYHTVHQLIQIDRVYTRHTRVDLYRMDPLYAFSGVTALTAVSLTVLPYGFLLINQGLLLEPPALGVVLPMTALAFAAFLWPLAGIRRLVNRAKQRALEEAASRLRATFVDLHRRVDGSDLDGMGGLESAISGLQTEIESLRAIPAWPWDPETMRWWVSALLLPLVLWIVQAILQGVLGG